MNDINNNIEEKVERLLAEFDVKAVIFDLDGTILDNNSFHLETWKKYLEKAGRHITEEEFNANFNGRTNQDVVKYLYGENLTAEEALQHTNDKEALYRELYRPHIEPIRGLLPFLSILEKKHIPMAIATSGIQPNIDFMFEHVPIKKYFKVIVNSSHIKQGKPDPEIYLKAAELLGIAPENCLVFEDAVVGIDSAKAAGMKVVAITTTQPRKELAGADAIIDDYTLE
jgi:beta-phosphoglucomutase